MARTLIASDDFNRADGGLGANWTSTDPNWGNHAIVSNKVQGGANDIPSGGSQSVWSGAGSFSDDQYSKCTLSNLSFQTAAQWGGVLVRSSTDTDGARDHYGFAIELDASSTKTARLYKFVNGTYTSLDTDATINWVDGDTISLEVVGTTLTCYRNDTVISGLSATDSSLTTGKPGIGSSGAGSGAFIDDWEGGNISSVAAPMPAVKRIFILP